MKSFAVLSAAVLLALSLTVVPNQSKSSSLSKISRSARGRGSSFPPSRRLQRTGARAAQPTITQLLRLGRLHRSAQALTED